MVGIYKLSIVKWGLCSPTYSINGGPTLYLMHLPNLEVERNSVQGRIINPCIRQMTRNSFRWEPIIYPLVMTHIAIENGPIIWDLPISIVIFHG